MENILIDGEPITALNEYKVFRNAETLKKGVLITEQEDATTGKVIYCLSDLPIGKRYYTPQHNRIERMSETELLIGDHKIIIPKMLSGEQEHMRLDDVEVYIIDKMYCGTLVVTNYQLILIYQDNKRNDCQMSLTTLGTISRIEKSNKLINGGYKKVILHRKDTNADIKIKIKKKGRSQLVDTLNKLTFPSDIRQLFCFKYNFHMRSFREIDFEFTNEYLRSYKNVNIDGWKIYENPFNECKRMRLNFDYWKISDINKGYKLCKSYPEYLVIPKESTEKQLKKVSAFRTQNRIPILSWYHYENETSITRSSQPRTGVNSRSSDDELYLDMIRKSRSNKDCKLIIIDPRPKLNARANKAVGAGYENKENYCNIAIEFMGIENIHVIRQSLSQLKSLCLNHKISGQLKNNQTDNNWLSSLEATGWMKHIKYILNATLRVIKYVHKEKQSCIVHCSDGWDRTSQVVSLSMLCMDPFYRTITGFCTLIEKEWKSAGHMFKTRIGHGDKNYGDENRSPIFLQWIDCVYQLMRQNPTSFEFNESLLIRILDETLNCRFGTFMTDNDEQSFNFDIRNLTVSFWTHVHQQKNMEMYTNPFYIPYNKNDDDNSNINEQKQNIQPKRILRTMSSALLNDLSSLSPPISSSNKQDGSKKHQNDDQQYHHYSSSNNNNNQSSYFRSQKVLYPKTSMSSLSFWSNFYLRVFPSRDKSNELMTHVCNHYVNENKRLNRQIEILKEELKRYKNQSSSSSWNKEELFYDKNPTTTTTTSSSSSSSYHNGLKSNPPLFFDDDYDDNLFIHDDNDDSLTTNESDPISISNNSLKNNPLLKSPAKQIVGGPSKDSYMMAFSKDLSYTNELQIEFSLSNHIDDDDNDDDISGDADADDDDNDDYEAPLNLNENEIFFSD